MGKHVFEIETIDYTPNVISDIKREVDAEIEQKTRTAFHNKNVSDKLREVLSVVEGDLLKSLTHLGLTLGMSEYRVSYTHELSVRTEAYWLRKPYIKIECPTPDAVYLFEPKLFKCIRNGDGSWEDCGEYKGVEDFVTTFKGELKELYKANVKFF